MSKSKRHNPVAKHATRYNRARVFSDRKALLKRGYRKHRASYHQGDVKVAA